MDDKAIRELAEEVERETSGHIAWRILTLEAELASARADLVRHQTEPDENDPDGWIRRSALNHWNRRAMDAEAERDRMRAHLTAVLDLLDRCDYYNDAVVESARKALEE